MTFLRIVFRGILVSNALSVLPKRWLITCAALVVYMQAGFAMLEAGCCTKNTRIFRAFFYKIRVFFVYFYKIRVFFAYFDKIRVFFAYSYKIRVFFGYSSVRCTKAKPNASPPPSAPRLQKERSSPLSPGSGRVLL